jgi:SAM-dependent methyltransferase
VSTYDAFASVYDEWSSHMTEDVGFYVELARETEGPLVELAVGNGRVAIPVARETGRPVLGIDSAAAMLAQARERAAEAGVQLELREGDMRDLELDEPAGLIYCPFRSLLHLPTWHDRRRVFERVAASLRPSGRFAWNAFVFDPLFAARHHEQEEQHGETEIFERVRYVSTDNRLEITAWKRGEPPRRVELWWINRSEWEGLVEVAGLEVEALYGWFDRRPFDEESREFVWVTRKPQ